MKFSNLSFLEKKEKPQVFLSLVLRNEKVKAVIFEKQGNTIQYVNDAEVLLENTIEEIETEDFLNALDKAITTAESALPQNLETHKTIFALKQSWVEDNKIKKEYLEKLKKAGSELSLDPIGFLVFTESVINLIQKEEGAPISAVLAEIGNKLVSVTLTRSGKILETRTTEIGENLPKTVDMLLKHFQTPEVLPSRIILIDSDGENTNQDFVSHSWSRSLPFLHVPQVLGLPKESDVKAVLLGAATQMNSTLIFDMKHKPRIESEEQPKKEVIEKSDTDEILVKADNFSEDESGSNVKYAGNDSSMEFFGFVKGDVAKNKPSKIDTKQIADEPKEIIEHQIEEIPEDVKLKEEQKEGVNIVGILVLDKIKIFLGKFFRYLKSLDISAILNGMKKLGPKSLTILGGVLLIILAILFYLFVFSTSATITISQTPKEEEKSTAAIFSPNEDTNIGEGIIAAEIITVEEEGSISKDVTGKKDVGTKAKGTVTIFNNDTDPVNLSDDTIITASNGQKFKLDNAVSVASASGDIFSGTKPGTKNVNVTAEEIGTEANVPSDTKFTVGTSKTVAAKNDNAFSGGTKKNVTVVSKEDLQQLLTDLPKQLSDKAKSEAVSKVSGDKTVITNFIDTTAKNQSFSKKEGDEAKQLTLKATVSFDFVAYNKNDMLNFATELFDNSTFIIDKNKLEVIAKDVEQKKNEDISSEVTVKAKLYAKIDTASLAKEIAGGQVTKVKNRIRNMENIADVTISISPNLPFISGDLPKNPDKIKIMVTAN